MTPVLDEHSKEVLRTLRRGDQFTLKNTNGKLAFERWEHPVEAEPWARAWELDYMNAFARFRAIRVSRIDKVLPMGDA